MKKPTEKQQLIYKLRNEGMTFTDIGKRVKLTGTRVADIYRAVERHKMAEGTWGHGLSVRAGNILGRFPEIETKEQLMKAYTDGKLHGLRNCGNATIREIVEWLGLKGQPKLKYEKQPKTCPHCGKTF